MSQAAQCMYHSSSFVFHFFNRHWSLQKCTHGFLANHLNFRSVWIDVQRCFFICLKCYTMGWTWSVIAKQCYGWRNCSTNSHEQSPVYSDQIQVLLMLLFHCIMYPFNRSRMVYKLVWLIIGRACAYTICSPGAILSFDAWNR